MFLELYTMSWPEAFMGRRKMEQQGKAYVLRVCGNEEAGARSDYSRFVRKGIGQGRRRQKARAEARRVYCYWAVVEMGYSLADLARLFSMSGQGVEYAV